MPVILEEPIKAAGLATSSFLHGMNGVAWDQSIAVIIDCISDSLPEDERSEFEIAADDFDRTHEWASNFAREQGS